MQNRFVDTKTLVRMTSGWPLSNPGQGAVLSAQVPRGIFIRTVKPVRVIFAVLFPALWLAASTNSLLDPAGGNASNAEVSLISTSEHARHDASDSVCSLEQSARRSSRRLNDQSGPAGTPTSVATSQFELPELKHLDAFSVGSRSSFGLAQCWQFRWRTALEPRAPSPSVS